MKRSTYFAITKFILVFCLFMLHQLTAITLVYNMRIRRVFNIQSSLLLGTQAQKPSIILTAAPILFNRDRHIVTPRTQTNIFEHRWTGGAILNARYVPSRHWWFEVTTGIEREHAHNRGTSTLDIAHTGIDDFVFAGGYNMFLSEDAQLVVYGLGGIPSKRHVTLQEAQDTFVGTRFFSAGVGGEGSYRFWHTQDRALISIIQMRFLHFFSRRWAPILPANAKIQPGNVTDILCTIRYRHNLSVTEVGYNATVFTDQAVRLATQTLKTNTALRNSYYATYLHLIKPGSFGKLPLIIGVGGNIGRSKFLDTKIVSCWGIFGIIF